MPGPIISDVELFSRCISKRFVLSKSMLVPCKEEDVLLEMLFLSPSSILYLDVFLFFVFLVGIKKGFFAALISTTYIRWIIKVRNPFARTRGNMF